MITSLKTFTIAAALLASTHATFADGLVSMGFGSQITLSPPPAAPARPAPGSSAGSPPIYYSNATYVPPSITPPSMNLLPSYGYSTGLYFQPTSFRPPTFMGPLNSTNIVVPPTLGFNPPLFPLATHTVVGVNQNQFHPQVFNFTTNVPPQPHLTHGVLGH